MKVFTSGKQRFTALTLCILLSMGGGGCTQTSQPTLAPVEITQDTSCALDGMLLSDFPGPKAQIHYSQGPMDFFCDTTEMFSIFLRPEQQKRVRALYVQDMGAADWHEPRGHWIDARQAVYVQGSKLRGAMGPTLVSFADIDKAQAFMAEQGGKLYRFDEITPDMVVLDGGALHDQRM